MLSFSCSFYLSNGILLLLIAFSTRCFSPGLVYSDGAGRLTDNAILSGTVANCRSVMPTEATPLADATHSIFSSCVCHCRSNTRVSFLLSLSFAFLLSVLLPPMASVPKLSELKIVKFEKERAKVGLSASKRAPFVIVLSFLFPGSL